MKNRSSLTTLLHGPILRPSILTSKRTLRVSVLLPRPLAQRQASASSRFLALLLCGLLLGTGAAPAAEPEPAANGDICLSDLACRELYKEARALSRTGDLTGSAKAYRDAYERRPAVWLLLNLGRVLYRQGKLEEAIASFQRYLNSPTSEGEARIAKAREFLQQAEQELQAKREKERQATAKALASQESPSATQEAASSTGVVGPAPEPQNVTGIAIPIEVEPAPSPLLVQAKTESNALGNAENSENKRLRKRLGRGFFVGVALSGVGFLTAAVTGGLALRGAAELQSAQFIDMPSSTLLNLQERTRALAITTDVLLGASAAVFLTVVIVTFAKKGPKRTSVAPGFDNGR